MMKIRVSQLSQLPFVVVHMVVWRDYIILLDQTGKLHKVEISE